jgi:membrane protein
VASDAARLPFLASAITFDALLASLPLIILLLVGITHFLHLGSQGTETDVTRMIDRFLPPQVSVRGQDPIGHIKSLLAAVTRRRAALSLYAVPLFLWFSTRLFSSVRTALNQVLHSAPHARPRHFLVSFIFGKVRDLFMVAATLLLFAGNAALSAWLGVVEARGEALVVADHKLSFFVTSAGRLVTEGLAFSFALSLFFLVYHFAPNRRITWRAAVIASTFTALSFEVLKRLYGLYLESAATMDRLSSDANVGALFLFVLWVYYTALVFLYGGVVADTWEGQRLNRGSNRGRRAGDQPGSVQ